MYEDDGIERWRRGERRRHPGERAPAEHSAPSTSVSLSMSASHSSKSQKSLLSSSSSRSWKPRCRRTGEFCAAGHELLQIPVLDRQQYLRRKQMQEEQQEHQLQQQRRRHPFDPPSGICPPATQGAYSGPIEIECDCCSKIMSKEQNIAGCCLECDIDVCGDCFKNGQSYIDVVNEESRQEDMYDERHEQMKEENHLHLQRHNGRRPTYMGTGRVNYDHYPDPTVFQWSFTGSNCDDPDAIAPAEYFEKDFGKAVGVIRLDFYYTIGTVQTTMVDPIRGTIRELFTKSPHKMSQKSYRKILKNPRSYTNERYKKGSSKSIDLRQQVL